MKRALIRPLWIALALCALFALFTLASAETDPVSAQIEISPTTLSGPYTVRVNIQISNVGDDDLPGSVQLYDPDNNRVASFGSGGSLTLLIGQIYAWQGEWHVTQEQLNAGRINYKLSYPRYNDAGQLATYSKSVTAKITYNKVTTPTIRVTRSMEPEAPQAGQEVTISYLIANTGSVAVRNMEIVDKGIGVNRGDLTVDSLSPGAQITKTHTFTLGESPVKSAPTFYFIPEGSDNEVTSSGSEFTITPIIVNITATLTASKSVVNKGDTIDLVCEIKNAGSTSYKNIKITDASLGTLGSSISIGSKKTYKETKSVKVDQSRSYQFVITGEDSGGNPLSIVTNEVRVQTLEDAKPVSLVVTIENDRDVVYQEPFTAIFIITVRNTGEETVNDIKVTAAKKEIYTIASLAPGAEHVVAKEFTLSMGGNFQFAANAKDALGKDQIFTSNTAEIIYQAPRPTPSPTPTLTPTPTETPPESTPTMEVTGVDGNGEGGIGNILKYVLLGLLAVVVMGVGAMLILERARVPAAVASRSSGARSVEVYDHLARSERRDYTRAAVKTTRSRAAKGVAAGLAVMGRSRRMDEEVPEQPTDRYQPAPSQADLYAPPPNPYDEFEGEPWLAQTTSADETATPAEEGGLAESELADIPRYLEPEDEHFVPLPQSPYTTEVPIANPPKPVASTRTRRQKDERSSAKAVEPTGEDLIGSTGEYHLTRQSGAIHPKPEPSSVVEAEDPTGFARKQRARRGREINIAQFYEEDDG
ncbi:MAG: hypothetical protein LBS72_05930 [Oscillospiraceae bacterium]|jgi:hypothetical protein|nr:hypothetical protein [Oscillospiraceae bacterium]